MFGGYVKFGDKENIVDTVLEKTDPTPNIHDLFRQFNKRFFWDRLNMVEVSWSGSRMTTCAGLCKFNPRSRHCEIRLSAPLLSLRPRKDLVETLLHEMIHAYLFMTNNNKDRNDHGPEFHKHMYRINQEAGTKISVYHTFHDEVKSFKTHVWRCNGPCRKAAPFYGFVHRACNRAPGPNDRWWAMHKMKCSGNFEKVQEPADYESKKKKSTSNKQNPPINLLKNFLTNPKIKAPEKTGNKQVPNVANHVRNVWAQKYPAKRKCEDSVDHDEKKIIHQCAYCDALVPGNDLLAQHQTECPAKKNPCPVCASPVKQSELEQHLNLCLEDSMTEDFFNLSDYREESESVECPICNESVEMKSINSHIDECINMKAIREDLML